MYPTINIFGVEVASYGLCILMAAVSMLILVGLNAGKKNVDFICIFIIWLLALTGALVGAKLLYIFVTYPAEVLIKMVSDLDFSFIDLRGGLVFYGGLFGGIIGAYIGAKLMTTKLSYIEDCVVPYIPFAHAIGRVGCFFGGCCYGIAYDGICAVPYGKLIAGHMPDETIFPVQLLEACFDVIICIVLLRLTKKERAKYDLLFIYLASYGIMRFFTEFLRGDLERGVVLGISTSQWISIGITIVCIIRFIIKKQLSERKK